MRITEYNKILDMLADHATSEPGRERCRALLPMRDLDDIEKAQSETEAALSYVFANGSISFGNTKDFSAICRSLSIGTTLTAGELLSLASFLENVARVRLCTPEDENNPLFDLFDCLYPLSPLSSEIRRCIPAEDQIADDASPELRKIRRSITETDGRIHSQLGKMVNSTFASYLQDSVITMRDDRYCLPVKAEYKTQVKGIVHDSSSTGSTLFIEPASIVELGNSLRELALSEKKEIEKILAGLSEKASESIIAIRDDQENMTRLDFIFAKAELALDMNATRPLFNEKRVIRIRKGRHPLIDKKKVVPIDLEIGDRYDMIIITGPNTGGKTVTLKTIGLFELMGMAGLHIPAADRSELAVFRQVYADIGDEQSIEQSLSTFSSHMTSIVQILRKADQSALCLFDELGSGTDPTEGAALAASILSFLHRKHITTLATTHYAELKVFAMRTKGIVNASCEFDVETLQPTYRLLVGVPGKSNAFAISQKLGLPGFIIDDAKDRISKESQDLEDVLSQLDAARVEAEKARDEAARQKAELDRKEKILNDREKSIEEKRQKILDKANEEAADILKDAKETADRAISVVRKSAKGVDIDAMERERTALREKANKREGSVSPKIQKTRPKKTLKAKDLHLGDTVRILSMGLTGTVASLPDAKGKVQVRCGILNSTADLADLALVDEDTGMTIDGNRKGSALKRAFSDPNAGSGSGDMDFSRNLSISPELNLLGMTTDDAVMKLDKYLDDARMAHLSSVRIVHGKGTGALRKAVQDYLRRQKWIKSYRTGDFGEGDAGVTIVNL